MSIKNSNFLLQPMEHPRCFPHPSACACLPKVRRTQTWNQPGHHPKGEISHLHPGDSCPLAHSSHRRANLQEKPLGWQEKGHNPYSGAAVQQLGETGSPLEMALLVSCSLSPCSGSLPSVLAPTAGILILMGF